MTMLQLQCDNYTSTVHVTLLMLYSITCMVQSIYNALPTKWNVITAVVSQT